MSVNSYLSDLASSLVLSESENTHVSTSLSTIKSRLDYYFDDLQKKKVFGSYDRGTILPRRADEKSDIDLMVVFNNGYELQPQTFFNKLKDFANYYYSSSEVHQSCPTVVLELNHIKFELVPAYEQSYLYRIPLDATTWQYTCPDSFKNDLTECNKINNYKVKPVVRLMKWWNIEKNYRSMASFSLEEKLSADLKYAYFSCSSYTDYLKKSFESIKFSTDISRVDTALGRISKALSLEDEGYPIPALNEIKKVFPEL